MVKIQKNLQVVFEFLRPQENVTPDAGRRTPDAGRRT